MGYKEESGMASIVPRFQYFQYSPCTCSAEINRSTKPGGTNRSSSTNISWISVAPFVKKVFL